MVETPSRDGSPPAIPERSGTLTSSQPVTKDAQTDEKLSDQLEQWLGEGQPRTLGSLLDLFGSKAFAVGFIVLMAPSALPAPTGGVTNVLEIVAMLLALELIIGRRTVWLPERWRRLELGGPGRERFARTLVRRIRWIERFAHPHLRFLFGHRVSGVVFGILVFVLTLAAFLAVPFSGLDTLPSLGIVLLALAVLFENIFLAITGFVIGASGVLLVVFLGSRVAELVL